jgi:hypothetical protein
MHPALVPAHFRRRLDNPRMQPCSRVHSPPPGKIHHGICGAVGRCGEEVSGPGVFRDVMTNVGNMCVKEQMLFLRVCTSGRGRRIVECTAFGLGS